MPATRKRPQNNDSSALHFQAHVKRDHQILIKNPRAPSRLFIVQTDDATSARRSDFPALRQEVNGRPLVYLDNAATTQKPDVVIDTLSRFYQEDNANVHRGMYPLSRRATLAYENARRSVARFIGAESNEIIFTKGTTESLNLVAQAWGRSHLQPGDRILIGEFEHHSNIVPWYQVARATGAELVPLPPSDDYAGHEPTALREALRDPRTKVIAMTHVSNSLGITLPVGEICALARKHGVLSVVDAAQSAAHLPLRVRDIGCDFLAFSGHKCAGPTGIGVLFGRAEQLEELDPYQGGGEMIDQVRFEEITWKPAPFRFEAGTPPIAQAIGLAAALEYLNEIGLEAIHAHDLALGEQALEVLAQIKSVNTLSPRPVIGPLVSFNLEGVHAHDAADLAGEAGVALRAGHHCCQPLMRRRGVPGTLRASWFLYNTKEDIEMLGEALRDILRFFKRG